MLFLVALIQKPTKKEEEDGKIETLILPPTPVIAKDDKAASVQAVMQNKGSPFLDRLEECYQKQQVQSFIPNNLGSPLESLSAFKKLRDQAQELPYQEQQIPMWSSTSTCYNASSLMT